MNELHSIILAGGNSSRFGAPKPFLRFYDSTTFLERLVNVYSDFGCGNIVIVLNENHSGIYESTFPGKLKPLVNLVINHNSELGRFYSLKLGADPVSKSDFTFIQNIDNPFTDTATLQKLFDERQHHRYISPAYREKGGHPILIPRLIIDAIRNESDTAVNTKEFLKRFNKISVEMDDENILANINTPEEYENYFPQFAGKV